MGGVCRRDHQARGNHGRRWTAALLAALLVVPGSIRAQEPALGGEETEADVTRLSENGEPGVEESAAGSAGAVEEKPASGNAETAGAGLPSGIGETAEEDSPSGDAGITETEPASGNGETAVERTMLAVYEAEDAVLSGHTRVEAKISGYSGEGYVTGFTDEGDRASLTIEAPADGFYDIVLTVMAQGGHKENDVWLDEEQIGRVVVERGVFEDYTLSHVWMAEGSHELAVEKYWGYIHWDKAELWTAEETGEDVFEVGALLVNPNASENARRLMSYLSDLYGEKVLSGQYCEDGVFGHEMAVLWKATGKFPAMVGMDMAYYSQTSLDNGGTGKAVDKALEAWENNSIVTLCWHWLTPRKYISGNWYSTFYKENTTISLDRIMDGEDEEGYRLLEQDMDLIAKQLKILADADVPVLWRPLHEASGGWFWWGNCRADSYIKLYRLMYEKFTEEYGLNNLIWVWNGQSGDWYPGDDVTDIIGCDLYPGKHVYTSQYQTFREARGVTDAPKIITMSENGCLFDPDLALRDGAMWSYFGTWSGEFVTTSSAFNTYSEEYTEKDMLKKVYTHELVVTRDELPDLAAYPVKEDE